MLESKRKLVSCVIPFLNEEENLPVLFERIVKAMSEQPEDLELVFVDDGSTDGSVQWLSAKAKEDPRVKLLRLSRNFGHQIAITAGMDHACGDALVIIDADLQDPPEVIPELLEKWRAGNDVVYAVRQSREGESWLKKFLAASFYKLFRSLASIDVPVNAGDFRLLDRKAVDAMKQVRELHRFMRGLTSWVGFSQCAVRYQRAARYAGRTKYPVWKSLHLAWDAMTSFSGKPLRWMTGVGMVVAIAGLALGIRIVIGRVVNPGMTAPGWTSLAALILFIGGVQLMSMGLLGQYVSRIFEESKKRPLYFVRESVGDFRRDK